MLFPPVGTELFGQRLIDQFPYVVFEHVEQFVVLGHPYGVGSHFS